MTALVAVEGLVVRYGPAVALDGVSLTLGEGERVALIGANGAGKSSLLNAVCGVVRPVGGSVRVAGSRSGRIAITCPSNCSPGQAAAVTDTFASF